MTELDFDELDKAVNSLMAETTPTDTETVKPTTVAAAVTPAHDATVAVPSPAVRRRGQFMDVMHSSSNMRQTVTPVSRQAATIIPPTIAAAVTPDDQPTSPVEPTSESSDSVAERVTELSSVSTETSTDTLTYSEPKEENVDASSDLAGNEMLVTRESVVSPATDIAEVGDPLNTPFLTDAKVEKRPLGLPVSLGGLKAESLDDETHEEAPVVEPTGEEDQGTPPVIEPVPLPDELQSDVVAVEANEVIHEDVLADTPIVATPTQTAGAFEPEQVQPTSGGSITQQYQEQPSTGDQTSGAIFDTSTYHQPLEAQPAKKKSSALTWILWIVVLLIVGATAGAAWFYFTTQ